MFSLTFLLLIYAKFCHLTDKNLFTHDPGDPHDRSGGGLLSPRSLFKYSTSARSLFRDASVSREETELELYVEREPAAERPPSSRFTWGGNFRKTNKGKKENNSKKKEVPPLEEGEGDGGQLLHKHKHRIVFSDVVFKNRWSDVNSTDLISLKSEMLNLLSSKRYSAGDGVGSEWYCHAPPI
ncbi:hypothetical protein Taro_031408 [Colocasia esculenta]|uniref:Uncharacterized protein n=1 Tax=Colocasia esculenta TaxID=4460 RepID=A0A843W0V1_COLES|nr:hypothetical protein [Colocasia esculenta]